MTLKLKVLRNLPRRRNTSLSKGHAHQFVGLIVSRIRLFGFGTNYKSFNGIPPLSAEGTKAEDEFTSLREPHCGRVMLWWLLVKDLNSSMLPRYRKLMRCENGEAQLTRRMTRRRVRWKGCIFNLTIQQLQQNSALRSPETEVYNSYRSSCPRSLVAARSILQILSLAIFIL